MEEWNGSVACLKKRNGTLVTIPVSQLCHADRIYLAALRIASKAAPHLARTPYVTGATELGDLTRELVENGLSGRKAAYVAGPLYAMGQRVNGDRHLSDLEDRWVEIHGIDYRVASVRLAESITGIEELVVEVVRDDGQQAYRLVTPDEVEEISILPQMMWERASILHRNDPVNAFRSRGPPKRSILIPELQWKYKLVYDSVHSVWTDSEAAVGHALIAEARVLWQKSDALELIAESRWRVHRGNDYVASSHLDGARREYTTAIRLAPNYAEAYLRRAIVHREYRSHAEALTDLGRAIALGLEQRSQGFKRLHVIVPSYALRARIRSWKRMHDDAIADANRAIEFSPSDEKYRKLLFSVRKSAADDCVLLAVRTIDDYRSGSDPGARSFESAIAAADKAIRYNPDPANNSYSRLRYECRTSFAKYLGERAKVAIDTDQYVTAIALAETAIKQNPDQNDTQYVELLASYRERAHSYYLARARESLKVRNFDGSIEAAKTAQRLGPEHLRESTTTLLFVCYFLRAEHYFQQRHYEAAIEDWAACIDIDATHFASYLNRGTARYLHGEVAQALDDLNEAIRLDVNSDQAFFVRALIYEHLRQPNQVVADVTSAIKINPRESHYFFMRAVANRSLSNLDQAITDISEAIRLKPDAEYYAFRARLEIVKGDLDAADADIATVLRLNPDSRDGLALRNVVSIRRDEEKRKSPYYFNKDALGDAAIMVALAYVGGRVERKGVDIIEGAIDDLGNAEGFGDAVGAVVKGLAGLGVAAVGSMGKEEALNAAIDQLFPNLPPLERRTLNNLASEFLAAIDRALIDKQDPKSNIEQFFGGSISGVTRDTLKQGVKNKYPDLAIHAEVGDFLWEIVSAINSRRN